MYKKTFLTIALVAVFAVPSVSSASLIDDLLAQIQSLLRTVSSLQQQLNSVQSTPVVVSPAFVTPSISTCPTLGRDLYIGLRGNDVSSLQAFLKSEGAYTYPSITGYYGGVTQNAVASWQSVHGPISYGSPSTTGFGAVGPVTRSIIAQACAGTTPGVGNPIVCTLEYAPVCGRIGSVDKTYSNLCQLRGINATLLHEGKCGGNVITPTPTSGAPATCKAWYDGCNTCTRSYVGGPLACTKRACVWQGKTKCEEYFSNTNSSPVISGFSGPTTLRTNQTGTWTIKASDSLGGNLTYKIDWGENTYSSAYDSVLGFIRSNFIQSTTFTHSYTNAGTYTVKITVRNGSGREAQTSTTVKVGTSVVTGVLSATPASGRSPLDVTFSANVGGYTPYRHYIDFGDGTAQQDISCYAPADYCQSPGVVTHTYNFGGDYVATLYKRLRSYSLSATAISTARISVGGTACIAQYDPVCGLPAYACPYGATCQKPLKQTYSNRCNLDAVGATFLYTGTCENQWISNTLNITNPAGSMYSLGDDIRVWWNATVGATDVGMYLILEDAVTGQKFKSIKVDYQTGRATISTSDYCNEFFSDGLDAGCSSLTTNVISKAHLKYKIRGALYTPKDACFGFCAPGSKTAQTLVEDASDEFTIRGN
ncbi:hypothetical protein COB52_01885 [Candidatus Kaiserbacteria bacterium]|nr:MAG: hypothetical protein COB52_01885 [Candidatus Kaiserbacteria bacterium]